MTDFSGKGSRRVFAARLLREAQSQALTSGSLVPQIAALAAGTLVATDRLPAVSTGGTGKTLTPANFRAYILPDGDKGDITTSASGATWTIDNGAVTLAKQADVATATVFYRKTAGTGAPEVQTLATLKTDLGLTGTNSGDQTITLTGDVTGSGTGSFAATVANDAVTYAKMQNVSAASRLLGRGSAGGAGDVEELTLGTGLSLSGTVLSATSSGTGDVVGPASATDNAVARFNLTTGKLIKDSRLIVGDGTIDITSSIGGSLGIIVGDVFGPSFTGTGSSPAAGISFGSIVRAIAGIESYAALSTSTDASTSGGTWTSLRTDATATNGSGTVTSLVGHRIVVDKFFGAGTLTTATGIGVAVGRTAGTLTTGVAIDVDAISGTMTNAYGLRIGNVTGGSSLDYAIYTGTGLVRFGDVVNTTESYQVDGVKVVGNQGLTISDPTGGTVQDSEARTAINTIIDRLQAHGLIA